MIGAIIQARMNSTRLPNKVMLSVSGKPLLWHVATRVSMAKELDAVIVATTENENDDILEKTCGEWGIKCFRGSEQDVLDRYFKAAQKYKLDTIVRITADCPLMDHFLIDQIVRYYKENNYDYVSNTLQPNYPDGVDIEVFSFKALERAWSDAVMASEREHVTPHIYKNSSFAGKQSFRAANFPFLSDFSHIRLTVDEEDDFRVVKFIIENSSLDSTWLDHVSLLTQNIDLMQINMKIDRNEGYVESICKEKKDSGITIEKCLTCQDRARKIIPGMTQLLSKRPDQFSLGAWPCYYSKARGYKVWDLDGNIYSDMSIGGIGANILGYADADVDNAVRSAIRNGSSSSLNCPEEVELAELLCSIHPWADKVRFARTGGEAMTMAVRIARACTGREKVAFCGYHGWHDWYLSANLATPDALGGHLLSGLEPRGVPKALAGTSIPFRYNKIEELEAIAERHGDDLAAIVMEPVRNILPEGDFLHQVRRLATKTKAVLIFDEISSGFRLNSGGAHLLYGVTPDMAAFSKAIGNGYPISAVIGSQGVMQAASETFISSSNWTERVGFVAALATITKHMEQDVSSRLIEVGTMVKAGWERIRSDLGMPIKTMGIAPICSYAMDYDNFLAIKAYIVQLMLDRGFLASTVFYAMYSHDSSVVEKYLNALHESMAIVSDAIKRGDVESKLRGLPAAKGFARLN